MPAGIARYDVRLPIIAYNAFIVKFDKTRKVRMQSVQFSLPSTHACRKNISQGSQKDGVQAQLDL